MRHEQCVAAKLSVQLEHETTTPLTAYAKASPAAAFCALSSAATAALAVACGLATFPAGGAPAAGMLA